ncbi:PRC-barrel domain-containing protein [Pelotomaculum propionicicum]|uniref:PRC-barrel domain-containing protein n=1 Tax=Pelotomaculum propionicicum TaxID=258475 RepID=UPI003B7D4719
MRKSKRFASMPVFSLEEGLQIGSVKELVVDPAGKRIAALVIEQKGWFKEQRFIPYHKVHSVGDDAITIEKTSGVQKAAGLPDIVKLLKDKVKIIGAKIVAENGNVLGFIDEYYVEVDTGNITGLEFSGSIINNVIKGRAFLDISYVRTVGKEVIVVINEAVDNVFKLDGGLQETIKNVRETTGHIWESTRQKTREFGSSVNKSIEKVKKEIKKIEEDEKDLFAEKDEESSKDTTNGKPEEYPGDARGDTKEAGQLKPPAPPLS